MAQVEGSGTVGVAATTEADNGPSAMELPSAKLKLRPCGTSQTPSRPHRIPPISNSAVAFAKIMAMEGVAPD